MQLPFSPLGTGNAACCHPQSITPRHSDQNRSRLMQQEACVHHLVQLCYHPDADVTRYVASPALPRRTY